MPPAHARVLGVHSSAVALQPCPHRRQIGDAHFHLFCCSDRATTSLGRSFWSARGRRRTVGRRLAGGAAGCRRPGTLSWHPNLICQLDAPSRRCHLLDCSESSCQSGALIIQFLGDQEKQPPFHLRLVLSKTCRWNRLHLAIR